MTFLVMMSNPMPATHRLFVAALISLSLAGCESGVIYKNAVGESFHIKPETVERQPFDPRKSIDQTQDNIKSFKKDYKECMNLGPSYHEICERRRQIYADGPELSLREIIKHLETDLAELKEFKDVKQPAENIAFQPVKTDLNGKKIVLEKDGVLCIDSKFDESRRKKIADAYFFVFNEDLRKSHWSSDDPERRRLQKLVCAKFSR